MDGNQCICFCYYESAATRGFRVGSIRVFKFGFKESPLLRQPGLPVETQNLSGRPRWAPLVQLRNWLSLRPLSSAYLGVVLSRIRRGR